MRNDPVLGRVVSEELLKEVALSRETCVKQKIKPCREVREECSGCGNSMCGGPGIR